MKIRASRLPLAMTCPASMQPGEYELNTDGEAARLGTAVHEWLAGRLKGSLLPGDECFELLAVKYSLPVDDIRALSLRAWRLWREIEKWFPEPAIEQELTKQVGPIQMTGHVDVLSYRPEHRMVFVNDHKTGWLDSDHSDQVRAYGLMALEKHPEADQVHTCIMRVRDYSTDHVNYSRAELVAWSEHVVHRVYEERSSYQPGRHCSFCPRRFTCPAFRDWVKWAIESVTGTDAIDLAATTGPDLVRKVYDAKSLLSRLLDEVQEVLKSLTVGAGGSLPRDDDYQLQLISQIRQTIQFRESWPLLSARVAEEDWNKVFRVSKTELHKVLRLGAGRGDKSHAVQEVMALLEEAGALAETSIDRLELRKKQPAISHGSAVE